MPTQALVARFNALTPECARLLRLITAAAPPPEPPLPPEVESRDPRDFGKRARERRARLHSRSRVAKERSRYVPDAQLDEARRRYAVIEQERQEIQKEILLRRKKTAIKVRFMALDEIEKSTLRDLLKEKRGR